MARAPEEGQFDQGDRLCGKKETGAGLGTTARRGSTTAKTYRGMFLYRQPTFLPGRQLREKLDLADQEKEKWLKAFPELRIYQAIVQEIGEISDELASTKARQEKLLARFGELQKQLPIAERRVHALIDLLGEAAKRELERN